jgi:hypothetical protein
MTENRRTRRVVIVLFGACVCLVIALFVLSRFIEMNDEQRAFNETSTTIAETNDYVGIGGGVTATAKRWTPTTRATFGTEASR